MPVKNTLPLGLAALSLAIATSAITDATVKVKHGTRAAWRARSVRLL